MFRQILRLKGFREDSAQVNKWNNTNCALSFSTTPKFRQNPFVKYIRSLKWTPIPISVGFALLAYQHYRRVRRRTSDPNTPPQLASEWEITCYRMMPLKTLSRAWGWVNSVDLPLWAREPFFSWYSNLFGCDIAEAEVEELHLYRNLGEFFRRALKKEARPIDSSTPLVSPADGTVLHFGPIECGRVEQVKGVSYSLSTFLGPMTWTNDKSNTTSNDDEFSCQILKHHKGTSLFQFVIYLAPGDYHRFHSPADWKVNFRRHFAGELMSVNPTVAAWISGLFSLNERAVYVGEWEHGFLAMAAVGATNVGSIRVYGDEELSTNSRKLKKNTFADVSFKKALTFSKGAAFGEFNLGSTIVVIFEAPSDFKFSGLPGYRVKMGQNLLENVKQESFISTNKNMRSVAA